MRDMMDFMSANFSTIFKGTDSHGSSSSSQCLSATGQKVVCTPEVSLYTYAGGPEVVTGSSDRLEDKGGGNNGGVGGAGPGSNASGGTNSSTTSSLNGFQCGFCGKNFQQKNTFQNHLKSHREGEDPYQCDICSKTFAGMFLFLC